MNHSKKNIYPISIGPILRRNSLKVTFLTPTGDAHIYIAEAMAWLISLSNGLNGQETEGFEGRTRILENTTGYAEGDFEIQP